MSDDPKVSHVAGHDPVMKGGVRLGMAVVVMTIDDEGLAWLNENAEGWKDHIAATQMDVQRMVPMDYLISSATGPTDYIDMMRKDMARKLADAIVANAPTIDIAMLEEL